MSGVVSTILEAWDELRIHKLRVLLALIGVAVAVTAITGITAAVQILDQAVTEMTERGQGREGTFDVSAYQEWVDGEQPVAPADEVVDAAFERIVEQYGITYWSRQSYTQTTLRFPTGAATVDTRVVDPGYGTITRFRTTQGRWFTDADAERLAPALVVNESTWALLGSPALDTHPTVTFGGANPVVAEVVGVYANSWEKSPPEAYALSAQMTRWGIGDFQGQIPTLRIWAPPEMTKELMPLVSRDLAAAIPGVHADAWTSGGYNVLDGATKWAVLGIGGIALLLGGLGLVNIALVTVRHRIREIGIRRSFGATSGRVFFGVLMESVVATVVAGVVGVVIAVAVIKNIPVDRLTGGGLDDLPPFPLSAALVGMACATGVGMLAGLIPAIVAVRVKVIDAIRY
ncbi:ABC transporter permease [Cellulomonas sp. P22]|uniref:ABC transporter permease n=1 Tax=Cellulomonas sp. P22 TaxID=3373189 RepID=UPI0037A040F1